MGEEQDAPSTPVLSARRTPELVASPVADNRLTSRVSDVASRIGGNGCVVVDAGDRNLVSHRSDVGVIPASNQKLLTAAAALEVLGADTRFHTAAVAAAAPAGGAVQGDLFVVGSGDPTLTTEGYAELSIEQDERTRRSRPSADAIVDAGVRSVTGAVVADESLFDQGRYVGAWPDRFVTQNQTGPLSALSVDDGFADYPSRAEIGDPAPTFSTWAGTAVPAPNPAQTAAARLNFLLEFRGVDVAGDAGTGNAAAGATEVAGIDSAPVSDLVAQMLTFSDDQTAELLLKQMGAEEGGEGSTSAGAGVMASSLEAQGVDASSAEIVDGSGLAGENRVTCGLIAQILRATGLDSPLGQGMAIVGEPGTLEDTFLGTGLEGRLRAKTGSLNEVRALSGFVEVPEGDELTFSLILNGNPITEEVAALREELAAGSATYPDRPNIDDLDPEPLPSEGP